VHAPTPPAKPRNEDVRGREYLTEEEVNKLRSVASKLGRHGHRDSTMILFAFRHGLRVSELVTMRWDQVHMNEGTIYVRRCKGSKSGTHTMERDELTALKRLQPDRKGVIFRTERGDGLSESGFFKIMTRAGREAGFDFPIHPHMLRHACGYELTRAGIPTRMIQEWLGHRNIQHTVRYTELDPERFRKERMWNRK
jgi:type 1 fimbriae regulatory protein FimB/type 1 fimbriae regulatory protein FimE